MPDARFPGARPPGTRPRPVAGLPSVAGVAVAKAWLLELLAEIALEDAAVVPTALLAREAPALCDAVLEAIAGDAALERLGPGGDRAALAGRAGALTGASAPADVVAGVEALRAVLHRALRTDEDPALVADTGDRLAHVCALVAAAALRTVSPSPVGAPPTGPPPAAPPPVVVPPDAGGRVLVAQDLRAEAGHLAALSLALDGRDGGPVAILAVELDDRERLLAIDGVAGLEAALVRDLRPAEEALVTAAQGAAVLIREAPGRWWLVAPGAGTDTARTLADRCSTAFAVHAPERHGVPLRASIGVAVCPDDGTDAGALAEHADQGVFTARALGVPVA